MNKQTLLQPTDPIAIRTPLVVIESGDESQNAVVDYMAGVKLDLSFLSPDVACQIEEEANGSLLLSLGLAELSAAFGESMIRRVTNALSNESLTTDIGIAISLTLARIQEIEWEIDGPMGDLIGELEGKSCARN